MDAVGNLCRTPSLSDRRYGPGGRLEQAEGTKYEYDLRGNLISKTLADGAVWRYRWSYAGLLTEVQRPDGKRVRFEYDPFARRTKKAVVCCTDDDTETVESEIRYLWDGHTLLHELRDGEEPITWYWEPGTFTPVAKKRGRNQWSLAHDHLGTPTEMYDENGELVWQMSLDTFGETTFSKGNATDCPWRWPGQYEDVETGLCYNRFRYYDAETGTYLSPDPLGLEGGLRDYGYVRDPLALFDPLGLIERFFRYVSEAEARQSAGNLGGDNQLHPRTHKNRRGGVTESRGPKWIKQEGGDARLGNNRPPWRLDIEAEDGTRAWLNQQGIDFDTIGDESSVPDRAILKSAEPGSFGVGRNLLTQLNARIRRITGSQKGGNRATIRRSQGSRHGRDGC